MSIVPEVTAVPETAVLYTYLRRDRALMGAALAEMTVPQLSDYRRALRALAREVDDAIFTRHTTTTEGS